MSEQKIVECKRCKARCQIGAPGRQERSEDENERILSLV
jgi:hypothetical protein